ncbi:MAG TPA: hypothetical protein VMB84_08735 [Stellaceae bacterium]|nr:hypothetical protein [Stellaceae bacterium]
MTRRIPVAVAFVAAVVATAAQGACPVEQLKSHARKPLPAANNCVDLGSVPQISAQVVAGEPAPTKTTVAAPPAATAPYEGPTVGMTKPDPGVRATPIIGYHWSLD